MSYLLFKEKLNAIKTDEFERKKFLDGVQVITVAGFWIFITAALLVYGREKERKEQAAHRPPVIPEAVSVSKDQISVPTTQIERHK